MDALLASFATAATATSSATQCLVCGESRATRRHCGHVLHMKCCPGKSCPECGTNVGKVSQKLPGSTRERGGRATVGANGKLYVTQTQKRDWGRTTTTHEVRRDGARAFQEFFQRNNRPQVRGRSRSPSPIRNRSRRRSPSPRPVSKSRRSPPPMDMFSQFFSL